MISVATYVKVALEDSDDLWELDRGHLRSKPGGTIEHNCALRVLHRRLVLQLAEPEYAVSSNGGRLSISRDTYFVPDLFVIPRAFVDQKLREMPDQLEVYDEPMPLVVEVWSDVVGDYDVEEKLRRYQQRGDLELWRIHPTEQTLVAWRRRLDGSYSETRCEGGTVRPLALANVTIELARLFE